MELDLELESIEMGNFKNNLSAKALIIAHHHKTLWLKANRGIFVHMAKQLSKRQKITKQMVRMVYYGERRSARVERWFKRMRAPGFETIPRLSARQKAA